MAHPFEDRPRYDPAETEARVFARWLDSGRFHPEPAGTAAENYSIAIPPPNVTGALHMGHALNGAIQDTLIRYARMHGKRTKWILGTDHAGIATQTQVERLLTSEGTSREAIGRAAFVERVWRWREQYGRTIIDQYKRLGASCDYEEERFTLDEAYARAVLTEFVSLYDKGWIYRDNYMVNWDPGSRSAISDLEVEEREVTDTLYFIDYPLASGGGSVTVATVRPETMLGDTAIAVHPDDDRYTRLVGETAILPLTGRRLKIIADPYVKPEFGTGALKITPGHDPNDFEIGRAHKLDEVTVIGEDGRMTAAAGERFAGMTALEAREAVVAALREEGRINRTQPHTHEVPFSQRSGERIEPLISLQWFMRMDELAAPAIAAVREGRVRIHPEGQRRRYLDWLENIRPWCISRQLWWGHRLPVWYRGNETYVGMDAPEGPGWEQDPDVLDTWASSALWPFATLGWPDDTAELRAFYPTDVLLTARDILFLWVARMVMMGLEFVGEIPFSDVYVHSVVQAPDGRRMSKSLGTGIDPLALIDGGERPPVFTEGGEFPAYGADAVRFGLLAMSSTQDVRFNEEKIAQGRRLANKLYNASRLVLLRVPEGVTVPDTTPTPETVEDRWILSRLQAAEAELTDAIETFEFHRAVLGLYDFVYGELCDWYLEMLKPRLYAEDNTAAAEFALHVLAETLALAHPVIPFVTEEIWAHLPGTDELLMAGTWPASDAALRDLGVEAEMARAIDATEKLRGWRDGVGAAPGTTLPARLEADGYERVAAHVARLARFEWSTNGDDPVATVSVPGGNVAVLASAAVDVEAEARRAAARAAVLRKEIDRAQSKLANPGFTAKAPDNVVAAEREKLERLQRELDELGRRVTWDLEHAEQHLLSLELFGMRFGLDRMRRLLTALGSPQERFGAVHVVGTNGKSSTVRMTAAILEAHGLRTGAYLSPHLTTFAERIRIADADLEPAAFGAAVQRAAAAAVMVDRGLTGGERVTQFELLTAAALDELARREVDVAVIEAGLGGRWDATNVLGAPVVVLTNVGLEHTRWLGPTVADIAGEKLAVVQPDATLILGDVDPEVEALARATGAHIVRPVEQPVAAALPGYQRANFAAATAAARSYLSLGATGPRRRGQTPGSTGSAVVPASVPVGATGPVAIDPALLAHAAARAQVPGRLQLISENPRTVFDGAHNPSGLAALADALPDAVGERPVVAVVSILDDKDAAGMLSALLPSVAGAVFTASSNPRALSPATLMSLAAQLGGPPAEVEPDPRRALARAQQLAGPAGAVVATGSIYLVADLISPPGARRASAL